MGKIVRGIIIVAITMMIPVASKAQEWTGNVNAFLGAKALDEDDWEPAEEHGQFGILVDFKKKDWPVSIAIDLLSSEGDGAVFEPNSGLFIDLEGETTELNAGVRKIWDQHAIVRPYIGGGLAFISADATGSAAGFTLSDDDSAVGFWINGGVYWTLNTSFNIGLDLRYSQAEVTLIDTDVNAGGGHAGLILGYHW
jgi:hypothetical protein